jgi:hypothetical protein
MKLRACLVAAATALSLAACGSSTSGKGTLPTQHATDHGTARSSVSAPSSPAALPSATGGGGGNTAFCAKLEQASTKLGNLGADASDPASLKQTLQQEVAYFKDLESSAPAEIKPAVSDMANVLQSAVQALDNPSSDSASALGALAQKLPDDAQKLTSYIAANCK